MPSVAELQVVIGADTSEAESKIGSFGSGLGSMLGVGVAAAGAAVAAGVAVGVKAAGDLQQSVANISTIKPEIDTSAVFSSLNEMSTRIPQTAAQLGESLYNVFSSVNVSAEQGLQLVETFAKGAVGAGTDAQTFGTAAMGVMNAYGLSVDQASHISDVFFNTVKAGVVTGPELAASLGPVTQSAKAAGVSLDELGAMIVGVTKEGGPAAQNINNLNNLLQKITTKEAQKAMTDLGVKTTDATGAFRPTIEVMRDLKERLSGMTESARAAALQAIFPDAQARLGAQTIMSQIDAVDAALAENKGAVGAASAAYETMSATFNSQSKLLMNSLMSVLTVVGAAILPVITPLIAAFAQSLPGAFQSAMAALAPFGPMLQTVAQIASDAWGTLQQVFAGDWSPDASINPFVNALGVLATIVRDSVIPAVMALLAIDFSILSTVGAFIISQFQVVADWFTANMPLIQLVVAQALVGMQAAWEAHGAAILTIIAAAWTIISTTISTVLAVVLGLVTAFLQLMTDDWQGAWTTLQATAATAWAGIQTIIGAAITAIIALIDTLTQGALTAVITWVTGTTTAIVTGAQTWILAITTAWTTIATAISTAVLAIQTTISTWLVAISEAITLSLATVLGIVQAGWQAIVNVITGILTAMQTTIMAIWNQIPVDIQADLVLLTSLLVAAGVEWLASIVASTAAMLLTVTTWATDTLTAITTWGTNVGTQFTTTATTTTTTVTTMCSDLLTAITTWISTTITAITTWASDFLAPMTALIGTATAAMTSVGAGMLAAIAEKLAAIVSAISEFGGNVISGLRGIVGEAGSAAGAIGAAIIDSIRGAIMSRANSIADAAANAVRRAIQAAKNAVGHGGGDDDGRATGGPVFAGQAYTVGERGPELFMPGVSGSIIPNHMLSMMRPAASYGASGGTAPMQTIRLQVAIGRDLAEEIFIMGRDVSIHRGTISAGSF